MYNFVGIGQSLTPFIGPRLLPFIGYDKIPIQIKCSPSN